MLIAHACWRWRCWLPGLAAAQQPARPGPTLPPCAPAAAVDCGAHPGAPGFGSQPDSRGIYQGLDADICRAVAAAVLGDPDKHALVVR